MSATDNSTRAPKTTVLIVADVRLYREGLASGLSTCARLSVVGSCSNRTEARECARAFQPDVVLVDVVATFDSLALIRDLRGDAPRCRVLAFAVDDNATDIIECAEAGAAGYVPADASIADVITAIDHVVRAELVCSPRIAAQLFGRISDRSERERPSWEPKLLTSRERQVLGCIRQGQSNKEIAQQLNIAETTVKNHVHHLLEKLDVTTRAQAAARGTPSASRRRAFSSRSLR